MVFGEKSVMKLARNLQDKAFLAKFPGNFPKISRNHFIQSWREILGEIKEKLIVFVEVGEKFSKF